MKPNDFSKMYRFRGDPPPGQVSTHAHAEKWRADRSCHRTMETRPPAAVPAEIHRRLLIADDRLKKKRESRGDRGKMEDLLPAGEPTHTGSTTSC